MDYDWATDTIIFCSNLTLHHYGFSHTAFSGIKVSLEGELQNKTSTGVDSNGHFIFKVIPERTYDFMNFKKVKVYYPGTMKIYLEEYQPRIILEGREVLYTRLT